METLLVSFRYRSSLHVLIFRRHIAIPPTFLLSDRAHRTKVQRVAASDPHSAAFLVHSSASFAVGLYNKNLEVSFLE